MDASKVYSSSNFEVDLKYSQGVRAVGRLTAILQQKIPGCTHVHVSQTSDDFNGTDFWAARGSNVAALSIDLKARRIDPITMYGEDDLALETWSKLPTGFYAGKVGWTRDATKETDYIVWLWETTGRFAIVPFPPLCKVFTEHWEEWRVKYKTPPPQNSGGWKSECVFVPRRIVYEAIQQWADGEVVQHNGIYQVNQQSEQLRLFKTARNIQD